MKQDLVQVAPLCDDLQKIVTDEAMQDVSHPSGKVQFPCSTIGAQWNACSEHTLVKAKPQCLMTAVLILWGT